jgi:glutaminase
MAVVEERFISTGRLPDAVAVAAHLHEAHRRFAPDRGGRVSSVYPALERADADAFGLCVAGTAGSVVAVGDASVSFPVMSVSKPFVFALVCERLGPETAAALVGVEATGLPFDSLAAVEASGDGRTNPMVNSGAIAATSHVPGPDTASRWAAIVGVLSAFAGRDLVVNEEIYDCATRSNLRNRAIVNLLASRGGLGCDPGDALDLYTRQCSLDVTAADLAVMGATLADGGVNPCTGERVVGAEAGRCALAAMTTAGLYERSGSWLYEVGLPGKSGIGGGIVMVAPGKGGLGAFSPPLDEAGNSVRSVRAAAFLSRRLGLDLFASAPEDGPRPAGSRTGEARA